MKRKGLFMILFLGSMMIYSETFAIVNAEGYETVPGSSTSNSGAGAYQRDSLLWCVTVTEFGSAAISGALIGTAPGLLLYGYAIARGEFYNNPLATAGLVWGVGGYSIGAIAGSCIAAKCWNKDPNILGASLGSIAGTVCYVVPYYLLETGNLPNGAAAFVNMWTLIGYFVLPAMGASIGALIEDNIMRESRARESELSRDKVTLQVLPALSPNKAELLAVIHF